MLQRSSFAQKRHLDWTSARCKYRPTFNPGRHPFFSTQSIPRIPVPSVAPKVPIGEHSRRENPKHAPRDVFPPSIPNEVSPVIEDLVAKKAPAKVLRSIESSPKLLSFFSDGRKTRKLLDALAQSSSPIQSLQILELAHRLGHTLKQNAYESVCFHLAASQKWDVLFAVVRCSTQHIGSTSVRLLNWRARALMETRQYSFLQNILYEFRQANLSPNQKTYHLMLTGCIRNYDMEGAKRCLGGMKEAGFSANATTHALISSSYRQFGADLEVRRNALASLPDLQPDTQIVVVNNLIQSSLEAHDLSSTLQLLTLFDAASIQGFVTLVSSQVDAEGFEPRAVSLQTLTNDLKPNADTFAIFMNHQIRSSDFEGAVRLWKTAVPTRISATPNVIASLVHAYFLQGRGNTAIRMIAGISAQPSSKDFLSLMAGFDHGEDAPPLNISCPALTTRICNALLRGILRRQGLAPVPEIFSIMYENNLKPNNRTLELLLSHMNHAEEPRPRTLLNLLRNLLPSIRPSAQHMHHIISCILRDEKRLFIDSAWKTPMKGGPRRVNERYRRIRLLHLASFFDPTAGLALGKYLSYSQRARPILGSLMDQRVKSDPAMIFLRIRRDAVLHLDIDSAYSVFRTLVARGMHPNEYHFGALVEGYALSGNFASAQEVMTAAQQAGIKPNIVMYTTLIAAHARHRDSKSAMRAFKEMVAAGIRPDIPSIDALVSAFYAADKRETARHLLMRLWTSIQPFPDSLLNADLATMLSHFRALQPYRSKGKRLKIPQRYSIYHHVKRLLRAHKRYFGPSRADLPKSDKEW